MKFDQYNVISFIHYVLTEVVNEREKGMAKAMLGEKMVCDMQGNEWSNYLPDYLQKKTWEETPQNPREKDEYVLNEDDLPF